MCFLLLASPGGFILLLEKEEEDFDRRWEFGTQKGGKKIQNGMGVSVPCSAPGVDSEPPVDGGGLGAEGGGDLISK